MATCISSVRLGCSFSGVSGYCLTCYIKEGSLRTNSKAVELKLE